MHWTHGRQQGAVSERDEVQSRNRVEDSDVGGILFAIVVVAMIDFVVLVVFSPTEHESTSPIDRTYDDAVIFLPDISRCCFFLYFSQPDHLLS